MNNFKGLLGLLVGWWLKGIRRDKDIRKICENCRYYHSRENKDEPYVGTCNCKKFTYLKGYEGWGERDVFTLKDGLGYWDADRYKAGFEVGINFGCIHWKGG